MIDFKDFEKLEFLMFSIERLADQLLQSQKKIIKLTLGKCEFPLSDQVVDVFKNILDNKSTREIVLPHGLTELKQKISQRYKTMGINVDLNTIIIHNGTSPIFKSLFSFLLKPNDVVVLPKPYYPLYLVSALLSSSIVKYYNINTETGEIDFESLLTLVKENSNIKLIVINNPGNPLGNVIKKDDLYKLYQLVDNKFYIISDEIYDNIVFNGQFASMLEVSDNNSNIIITNGFSKGHRMYSRRLGFAILPPQLIPSFQVILEHTVLTVDPALQYAGIKALELEDEVKIITDLYKKRSEYTYITLLNSKIKPIFSEGSFYFSLDCRDYCKKNSFKNSVNLAIDILNTTGVALVPGEDFGLSGFLRLSFTNSQYEEAIDRLYDYFK
jgi:aspartate/methionine/tyrosine aminotransferase